MKKKTKLTILGILGVVVISAMYACSYGIRSHGFTCMMIATNERPAMLGSDPKNETIGNNSWTDITLIQEMPDYIEYPRYRIHADVHGEFKTYFSISEMKLKTDFLVDPDAVTNLVKSSFGLSDRVVCKVQGSLYEYR